MESNAKSPSTGGARAAFEAALDLHHAAFQPAREAIARHDGLRHRLVEAMRLQAAADDAARANQRAVLEGLDTSKTLPALQGAVRELVELDGGYWAALFWFLTSPTEDLTHDRSLSH